MTTTGEVPKTLSEKHFDFLRKQIENSPRRSYTKGEPLSHDKSRRSREQAKIRQQYQHIRDVAKKEMKDLADLADLLSDKQYDQLFSVEVAEFTRLLKTLLTAISGDRSEIKFDSHLSEHFRNISENRRISMLKLLDWLLWEIGDFPNVIALAKNSHQTLMMAGSSEWFSNVIGLKAILIEADRECDTTVYREMLKFPNSVAKRMEMEGRFGYERGRP